MQPADADRAVTRSVDHVCDTSARLLRPCVAADTHAAETAVEPAIHNTSCTAADAHVAAVQGASCKDRLCWLPSDLPDHAYTEVMCTSTRAWGSETPLRMCAGAASG